MMDKNKDASVELSLVKQALFKIKALQAEVDALQSSQSEMAKQASTGEPVAIVSTTCRFPSGVNDLASFWQLLCSESDVTQEIPKDRWDVERWYSRDTNSHGKMFTRRGAFLHDVQSFDPEFFGISAKEALYLDPNQRLLFECSWEALENAGYAKEAISGSNTGIYISANGVDYVNKHIVDTLSEHSGSGAGNSYIAGRLAHFLASSGPAISVDTACSSSLTAIHLACESLRKNEIDMAIVGASSVYSSPVSMIMASQTGLLSLDGRCKTFSDDADGYGCGEGCAVVILKRLSDALASDDPILAVIKGSAVNQNGETGGFTVPSAIAQQNLINQALKNANIKAEEISYIEAHGTGSALADPVEVSALAKVFRQSHSDQQPLYIGSVKTNIGHLGPASGLAGLLKVIVSLQNKKIPAHLNCQHLNQQIPWEQLPIKVATQAFSWLNNNKPRIAGVSAFGMNGTNAHLIISEAPVFESKQQAAERSMHLFMLSAKSVAALEAQINSYQTWLLQCDSVIADICLTTSVHRSHFNTRAAFVVSSVADLIVQLTNANGSQIKQVRDEEHRLGWLFSSNNHRLTSVSLEFYETSPEYASYLNEINELFKHAINVDLMPFLFNESTEYKDQRRHYEVPILFMLQYSMGRLLFHWGIKPDVIIAYSVGEYAAACLSGVFSLQEAVKLVVIQHRLLVEISQKEALITEALMVAQSIHYCLPCYNYISGLRNEEVSHTLTETRYWFNLISNTKQYKTDLSWLKEKKISNHLTIGFQLSFGADENVIDDENFAEGMLEKTSWSTVNNILRSIYLSGISIDWSTFIKPYANKKIILPNYIFQRQRYWLDALPEYKEVQPIKEKYILRYPLLGEQLDIAYSDEAYFNAWPSIKQFPYFNHYRIANNVVFPVGAFIDIALSAANNLNISPVILKNLEFNNPLVLPDANPVQMQSIFRASEHYDYRFRCLSKLGNEWQTHASGILKADFSLGNQDRLLIKPPAFDDGVSGAEFYRALEQKAPELYASHGPDFHCVQRYVVVDSGSFSRIELPADYRNYVIHPIIIHTCFQMLMALHIDDNLKFSFPVSINKCCVYQQPMTFLWCHAIMNKPTVFENPLQVLNDRREIGDLRLYDEKGKLIAEFLGVSVQVIEQMEADNNATIVRTIKGSNSIREEDLIILLKKIAPSERKMQLSHYFIMSAAWVLNITSGDLDPEISLISQKLDNAMSFRLSEMFKHSLFIEIPVEYFLQNYSVDEMTDQIWSILIKKHDWLTV